MHLVDPSYPKSTRRIIYVMFALMLAAVLTLGAMSIARSLSEFAHVGEGIAEINYQAKQELETRLSEDKPYEEKTPSQKAE